MTDVKEKIEQNKESLLKVKEATKVLCSLPVVDMEIIRKAFILRKKIELQIKTLRDEANAK